MHTKAPSCAIKLHVSHLFIHLDQVMASDSAHTTSPKALIVAMHSISSLLHYNRYTHSNSIYLTLSAEEIFHFKKPPTHIARPCGVRKRTAIVASHYEHNQHGTAATISVKCLHTGSCFHLITLIA